MTETRFLLDSNICIYLIKGTSDRARQRVEDHEPGEIVTSAVAYAEVMRGLAPDDLSSIEKANGLFRIIEVLPFDADAAAAYARLPFHRHRFDRLIAAHALSLELTLVTSNPRDFLDVPDLRIEDWTQ